MTYSHSRTRTANAIKMVSPVAMAKAISIRVLTGPNVTRALPSQAQG